MSRATVRTAEDLPFLGLRDRVLLPKGLMPIEINGIGAVHLQQAVRAAGGKRVQVLVGIQKDPAIEKPNAEDFLPVATKGEVVRTVRASDSQVTLAIRGIERRRLTAFRQERPYFVAAHEPMPEIRKDPIEIDGLGMAAFDLAKQLIALSDMEDDAMRALYQEKDPARLADIIAAQIQFSRDERISLLVEDDVAVRLRRLLVILQREVQFIQVKSKLDSQVKEELSRHEHETALRERLKAIREELGEADGIDLDRLWEDVRTADLPEAVLRAATAEYDNRIRFLAPDSPEFEASHHYIRWLLSIPWRRKAAMEAEPRRVLSVLEDAHFGADEVKAWLVEELAIAKLVTRTHSRMLCFVGPPGVGKTTLAQAVAKALGRPLHTISLGGAHDEALLSGQPRIFPGAQPGVFVRALSAAGLANPVVLLDELDKLSTGQRGDPHAALLEILDPVRGFRVFDRYLQLEVDLSDVLFIATANDIRGIHPALQSRLEIVEFLGYDLYEKHQIARKYLWAKCLERCGLDATRIQLLDSALPLLIRQYTREAGVRDLDKRLDELCRQIAHKAAGGLGQKQIAIDDTAVAQYLGPSLFFPHSEQRETMVGRAHAAAITEAGSAVYPIDCATMASDQARLTITGEQGSSGQEPCELALSLLQSRTALGAEKAGSSHFHVHLEGGIRSLDEMKGCGAAILLSMVSSLREKPLPQDTAVLGELSLLGEVRGVARLHAKILTAQRFGVRHLLLPVDNKIDVHHLPAHTTEEMNFEFVSDAEELVTKAFA